MNDHVIDAQERATAFGLLGTRVTLRADEIPEHRLDGFCWCQPLVEYELPDGRVFIHRRTLDSPHIEVEP